MSTQTPPGDISPAVPTSSLAIISLIAGILGLSLFPILGSVVAVITGPMARREIRESGGTLGGDGLATAGLVLGWIGIGLTVIGLCGVFVVIPACIGFFIAVSESAGLFLPALLALV